MLTIYSLLFLIAIPKYAKTGCNDMCGNVRIPYPFGIGADCSVNKWYIVDCKSSKPYLPALNHLELLGVNMEKQSLNVSTPKISDCRNPVRNSSNIIGVDLRSSPFWFSENNNFVFEGCGTATMHMDNGSVLTACSTTCPSVTLGGRNTCFGIRCCHTSIPNSLKSFSINITGLDEEDRACGSAFLVEDKSSYEERFSDSVIVTNSSFVPISLVWTLTASDPVTCCSNISPEREVMDMLNGTTVDTWICDLHSLDGSPYLIDGCVESKHVDTGECRRCEDSGGYCQHDGIYDVDGSVFSETFTCHHDNRTSLGVILGNVFSYI
ncbi:putative wall-associated receptor kinase [Helianthus annuus]|nr:putative wall-associated receptor kinase [Helianthus annuus]